MTEPGQEGVPQDSDTLGIEPEESPENNETESSPETAHVSWASKVKKAIAEKFREFYNTPRYVSLESPLDKVTKWLNRPRMVKL